VRWGSRDGCDAERLDAPDFLYLGRMGHEQLYRLMYSKSTNLAQAQGPLFAVADPNGRRL
jgi:hypothetical protein